MTGKAGECSEGKCSHWVRPMSDGVGYFYLQVHLLVLMFMKQYESKAMDKKSGFPCLLT